MRTKLFTIIIALTLSVTYVGAQETSFGILGGINMQNLNGKDMSGDKITNEMIIGWHAGLDVQIPVAPEFYFAPGLLFSIKGAKNTGTLQTTTTKLSYIEMPLNLVYKAGLGNGQIMLGFGPYIAYALKGNVNTESGSISLDRDVEFKNVVELTDPLTTPYYKAFDAGANIFFGYVTGMGIFAQLDSQLGLLNINPEYKLFPDDKSLIKNTGFGISVGYRF
jgi:hypothetical protein